MAPQRRAALGLWAALTFSLAVIVHGAIHAAGSPDFVWDSPAHVAMLAAALGLLAAAVVPLGLIGPGAERRRRLALVRAGLGPVGPLTLAVGALVQALTAVLLLAAEGISLQPDRLIMAIACGLLALLCSAFLFRAARDRAVAALVTIVAVAPPAAPALARRRRVAPRLAATIAYRLFVPNRPPPMLAA